LNIFVLDEKPNKAAEYQCDKHVVKMVLESAQLMSTAVNLTGGTGGYKPTHKNHPCSIWARQSKGNFQWLKQHALSLCEEYTKRYNKTHKSQAVIESLSDETIPDGKQTPFVLAMPEQYRSEDPVESYRNYYQHEKASIAKWSHSEQPSWFLALR
jgi:hypothetical protein